MTVRLYTPKETFTVDYPEARDFMTKQASLFWTHDEVKVEKDKHDILVNMTEAERHGVITVLKLFTKYEQIIGDEFWLDFVFNRFPRGADIQPMAAMFGAMELSVHAVFYSKLNEELGLATDEFYNEYKEDKVMKSRIEFLKNTLGHKDDLHALGAFTFAEGAVLYTSFAYLKHFQSAGKNKLLNVVSGINFSARDEALHSEAAGWLFRTLKQEMIDAGELSKSQENRLQKDMLKAANAVYDHEAAIVAKIFSKGKIEGITEKQLLNFAKSRVNICLRNMGYDAHFHVPYNPVGDTFYKGINGYQATDFFTSVGREYQRDWSRDGFVW